jgi:hypothetical protein
MNIMHLFLTAYPAFMGSLILSYCLVLLVLLFPAWFSSYNADVYLDCVSPSPREPDLQMPAGLHGPPLQPADLPELLHQRGDLLRQRGQPGHLQLPSGLPRGPVPVQ